MLEGHRIGAIILASGDGIRFGNNTPKQFLPLAGQRVYLHTLRAFEKSALFDEIILVCHPEWIETISQEAPHIKLVAGGQTRQQSSFLGLSAFETAPTIVAIHDAVRPLVSSEILYANVTGAIRCGAVDTCIPSADTLVFAPTGSLVNAIPPRAHYLRGQTPQTFRFDWIYQAHLQALQDGICNASDDCHLVLRQGHPIEVVQGSDQNVKITTYTDLILAEHLTLKNSGCPKNL